MICNGIPTVSESRQASARAAGRKRNDYLRRLVRITGPDAGVFTIAQIAERLGVDESAASRALRLTRPGTQAVTWARLADKAQRAAQVVA